MLRTRHEWISKLAAGSGVIAGMRLENDIENADLDTDAFILANCDAHCRLITRAIDELVTHNFSSSKSAGELQKRWCQRVAFVSVLCLSNR
jgi:hypothetical protein